MDAPKHPVVTRLAESLVLGALLEVIRRRFGGYELVDQWQQGEFHHDVVVRVADAADLPGPVLVIVTNCNGGVKEVLCFANVPERGSLWHARCPGNPEFCGVPLLLLASAKTTHWFDPCELLGANARSEYREEFRERQCGGGWMARKAAVL